nr:Mlp family lipoprotein [Borreliella bavariensis]
MIILNSCNSSDNNTFKKENKSADTQQSKIRKKRDLSQEEPQQEKITITPDE